MKQTVEEAAKAFAEECRIVNIKAGLDYPYDEIDMRNAFEAGAEWQAKQSPWISVKEQLPEELTSVLVRSEYEGKSLYEVAFVINGKWKCHNGKPTHWCHITLFRQ
jgi:hypothetical protein